jgi:hypothetical protein
MAAKISYFIIGAILFSFVAYAIFNFIVVETQLFLLVALVGSFIYGFNYISKRK